MWTFSEKAGRQEASAKGGQVLLREGFVFDVAYTSVLKARAIRTLWTRTFDEDGPDVDSRSSAPGASTKAPLRALQGAEQI